MKVVIAIAVVVVGGIAAGSVTTAQAGVLHRHTCHIHHVCPSDHATYRWGPRRLLCVKPTSDKDGAVQDSRALRRPDVLVQAVGRGRGFRKSKKLFPGVRLTVSKRGASVSAGPKGAKVSMNTRGERRVLA
jgi:hypothetical protein